MRPTRWAATLALVLAAAACTSSPTKPSGATGTEATGPSGTAGGTTTASPGATGGSSTPTSDRSGRDQKRYTNGTAHLKISGAVTYEKDLPLDPTSTLYSQPPENSGAVWKNEKNEQLALFGVFASGKTSKTLFLTASVPSEFAGISRNGECSVTFSEASEDRLKGGFTCTNWKVDGRVVNATGVLFASA